MSDPEIRIDQLTGMRTVLAAARSERPVEFTSERPEADASKCPFCGGREADTPDEVWADRPGGGEPNTSGWRVRSVPNLYPALAPGEAEAKPVELSRGEPELFTSLPATGAHEVIVHAPQHVTSLAELDPEQLAAAVGGWRERIKAHGDAACCQLIVNEGPDAGASREHSHAQLYALDFVPAAIARERERFHAYHERTAGGQLLSDISAEEVRRKERLVAIDDEALLICPWASRGPFELRIIPRRAEPSFEDGGGGAEMLGTAMRALAERFDGPPQLNLWVVTAPSGAEHFHWHIDIAPRLAIKAGFELSTGVDINTLAPERAAAELRDCLGQ